MKSSFLFHFNFYIFNSKEKIDKPFLITTVRFLMKITHLVYQMKNHGFCTLYEKKMPERSHERENYRFFSIAFIKLFHHSESAFYPFSLQDLWTTFCLFALVEKNQDGFNLLGYKNQSYKTLDKFVRSQMFHFNRMIQFIHGKKQQSWSELLYRQKAFKATWKYVVANNRFPPQFFERMKMNLLLADAIAYLQSKISNIW